MLFWRRGRQFGAGLRRVRRNSGGCMMVVFDNSRTSPILPFDTMILCYSHRPSGIYRHVSQQHRLRHCFDFYMSRCR